MKLDFFNKNDADEYDKKVVENVSKLYSIIESSNQKLLTYKQFSLEKALKLAPRFKKNTINALENYIQIMSYQNFFPEDDEPLSKEDEIECLQRALYEFGFVFGDDDFDFLDQGDIIEAYNLNQIQIYRNFELLKINPFDILTVLTHRWDELYERSKLINKQIKEKINIILESDLCEHQPFNIDLHHLKACNVETEDYLVAEIQLKFIKPLYLRKDKREKVGFVSTQKSSPIIMTGEQAKTFHLL